MRELSTPVSDGWTFDALGADPPASTTRKIQDWASGEEVDSGKLQNFQTEKEATIIQLSLRAPLSSEAREQRCKETLHPRGRQIPSPPLAPSPTARSKGRKRLVLLRQAARETDWLCK